MGVEQSGILIVDDDPGAIRLLRSALQDYPDVRFATSGSAAMRLARERAPDIILLDGQMPTESGFDVCKNIKDDAALAAIPIIFVTAHDGLDFEIKALALGAADFISKPISAPRVALRVKLHLQLKWQFDQLRMLASIDGLTQLANRRTFDETLAREWRRTARDKRPLSLVLIDVDFFKAYNDTYGHPAGDECLQLVAAKLRAVAQRASDLVARFGGEEFALLLAETPLDGAHAIANNLRASLEEAAFPHAGSSVAPHVTVSIGVSCSAHPSTDASSPNERDLIEAADRALYLAKQRGRNRVEAVAIP